TPIEECPCFEINDPRALCKRACIPTEYTSISECACLEINDPRVSCKKACIPTTDTPINECSCLIQNDPREQCQKTCIPIDNPYSCVPSYSTPISECPCLELNDPRQACKKACVPSITTPINECGCLAINDPRQECQKACVPNADTPINQCGCLAINDPRDVCKKACIPTESTPLSECRCLAVDDPRALCKRACIPTAETSISECACLAINDPRIECKTACIPNVNTPINECGCLDIGDPRSQCKKACIPTTQTSTNECSCLAVDDPRAQCKKSCIPTSTTPISEQCPCFAVNDPREACQTSCIPIDNPQTCFPTESTPINECGCLEIDDPRQACNPKQEILIPPQDIPDIPNITISPEVIKEIIINIVDRNESTNSVQNHIYEAILDQSSIEIQVQTNEIYEEQNIHITQNHKLVLNALNSSSNNPTPPPVLFKNIWKLEFSAQNQWLFAPFVPFNNIALQFLKFVGSITTSYNRISFPFAYKNGEVFSVDDVYAVIASPSQLLECLFELKVTLFNLSIPSPSVFNKGTYDYYVKCSIRNQLISTAPDIQTNGYTYSLLVSEGRNTGGGVGLLEEEFSALRTNL
ncbi:MAG: hypothetical protein EZS28_041094, partial [Streblomastix strix]